MTGSNVLGEPLEACGFAAQRPLTRMVHNRRAAFDDGTHTFAVVGPEFG